MARDGSGNYSRVEGPYVNGAVADADEINNELDDMSDALSDSINKAGTKAFAANQPMGGNILTGLGAGNAAGESVRYEQLLGIATTGSANAYVLSSGTTLAAYATGQNFLIIPNFTNSGAATINVDGLGAKNITKNGTTALASGDLVSGTIYRVAYDGTQFQVVGSVTMDATLTALAALSTSADQYIRATGTDTFTMDSLAAVATKLAGAKAAFSAHKNGTDQTGVSSATATKITFGTEAYDTGSYFDTTNSRWTPPAGKVRLSAHCYFSGSLSANTAIMVAVYKDGSVYKQGISFVVNTGIASGVVTCDDDASGSNYYEVHISVTTSSGNVTVVGTATLTYFQGEQL